MQRAWFVASILSLAAVAGAQSPLTPSDVPVDSLAVERAQRFRQLKMDGKDVYRNVRKLNKELKWHRTFEKAAEASKKSDKPILLVQALGDLKGFV